MKKLYSILTCAAVLASSAFSAGHNILELNVENIKVPSETSKVSQGKTYREMKEASDLEIQKFLVDHIGGSFDFDDAEPTMLEGKKTPIFDCPEGLYVTGSDDANGIVKKWSIKSHGYGGFEEDDSAVAKLKKNIAGCIKAMNLFSKDWLKPPLFKWLPTCLHA